MALSRSKAIQFDGFSVCSKGVLGTDSSSDTCHGSWSFQANHPISNINNKPINTLHGTAINADQLTPDFNHPWPFLGPPVPWVASGKQPIPKRP